MGKNLPFIEFFYKYAPAFPASIFLFFIDSIFSRHTFTPTDFQHIMVNHPFFLSPPFHHADLPLFIHYFFTSPAFISRKTRSQNLIITYDYRNHDAVSLIRSSD